MNLKIKTPAKKRFDHDLSSVILYTIAEKPNDPRKALEDMLKSLHLLKEGDQSTMILPANHSPLKPYELKAKLDKLCQSTQFSEEDCITLIRPDYQIFKLEKKEYFYRHILKRYKYVFDKNSNSFSITPDRRSAILKVEVKK